MFKSNNGFGFGGTIMTTEIIKRFMFIALFITICPSIFSKPSTNQSNQPSVEQLQYEREMFEALMVEARDQAKNIGFCMQQLLQTINAGKISLTKSQKNAVTQELTQIQDLTTTLLEQLFVQNSREALYEGILINYTLIDYLLTILKKDLKKINATAVIDQHVKRCEKVVSHELLIKLSLENKEKIDELIYVVDHIGLTWYNNAYRTMKKYNAYSIAKGVGIVAVSTLMSAYILYHCNPDLDYQWYKDYFGPRLQKDARGFTIPNTDVDEKARKIDPRIELNPDNATPMQKIDMTLRSLQEVGLLSIGALVAINLKDIVASMYKEPYNWAHDIASKKIKDYDQKLGGTGKVNVSNDGHEKVYFKDMVGAEELEDLGKKIASFMKHPERYERSQIEVHRGILLFGPPQTGKTMFASALRTMVEEELGSDQKLSFIDAKKYYDAGVSIEDIFSYAKFYAPCIIFFDEIDLIGTHRDKDPRSTSQLLTCMQGIDMTSKQVFVIGATNRPEQLDKALLVDGRFGKHIHIKYPEYEHRKIFLEQQLAKRCIQLSPEYIDCIAQETEGCSYNTLKRIITEAIILSSIETRTVSQADFEKTLDTEVRRIRPATAMSAQERTIIATYQAGKALARHLLKTAQEVVKVTINPVCKDIKTTPSIFTIDNAAQKPSDNEKLANTEQDQKIKFGEVFTKRQANHCDLLSDKEQEKECLALLAGSAALQIIMNDSFAQCNKQDRAEVMQTIYRVISQGEKIDDKIRAKALEIKEHYERQILTLLSEHKELLEKIIDTLVKNNTIDRYAWKALVE